VLKAGDTLRFTERIMRVSVAGQVARPGAYDIPIGSSLVEAIAQSGGATDKAALTRISITHADATEETINLYRRKRWRPG
jgi:protein involved in polysaccharide export with SLBB domain